MTKEEALKIAKPILFNTEMVRAILDGRKTVTRRIVKFIDGKNPNWTGYIKDGLTLYNGTNEPCNKKPPFKKGDYLYVRETWNISNMWSCGNKVTFIYRGDKSEEDSVMTISVSDEAFDKYGEMIYSDRPEWRPSIHMPKEAARIFLRVTDVRVERLQEITKDQILEEGTNRKEIISYINQMPEETEEYVITAFRCAFFQLWDSTIKKQDLDKYGWDANPWVWVIEFERIEVE